MNDDEIKRLSQIYKMSDELFEKVKAETGFRLSSNKSPSDRPTLVIVGGQAGAGKSRLSPIVHRDFNGNIIQVDFDEIRAGHPRFKDVNEAYPEYTHRILLEDTDRVQNTLLDEFRTSGYNILYEGTLRNTDGFVNLASKFKKSGYNVELYLMAVPELESLGSTYSRYAIDKIRKAKPRWVEKKAHDDSFTGLIRTLSVFQKKELFDSAKVFIRSDDEPKEIYSSESKLFASPVQAIEYGREIGRRDAVKNYPSKHDMVISVLKDSPELLARLSDWERLYEEESFRLFPNGVVERNG